MRKMRAPGSWRARLLDCIVVGKPGMKCAEENWGLAATGGAGEDTLFRRGVHVHERPARTPLAFERKRVENGGRGSLKQAPC